MKTILSVLLFSIGVFTSTAQANWSINLGYNNPPGSQIGFNFMHEWSAWAFEAGIGSVSLTRTDPVTQERTNQLVLGGDIGMKYFFGRSGLRPYLEGGFGASAGSTSSGVTGGFGGAFGGAGIAVRGSSVYMYLGLVIASGTSVQAGLGFDI